MNNHKAVHISLLSSDHEHFHSDNTHTLTIEGCRRPLSQWILTSFKTRCSTICSFASLSVILLKSICTVHSWGLHILHNDCSWTHWIVIHKTLPHSRLFTALEAILWYLRTADQHLTVNYGLNYISAFTSRLRTFSRLFVFDFNVRSATVHLHNIQ